jgi:hypothetical protein
VGFILTILLQRYKVSDSKNLIVRGFSKNQQLTSVLDFKGSCIYETDFPRGKFHQP